MNETDRTNQNFMRKILDYDVFFGNESIFHYSLTIDSLVVAQRNFLLPMGQKWMMYAAECRYLGCVFTFYVKHK